MNRAHPRHHDARRTGFSLVEILVMLGIIAIFMGITLVAFPRRQSRDASVRGAAEELVGVLRSTRSRAMERRATYIVTFNIQNTPGTSGAQLMNGNGGHWYRVVGPLTTAASYNLPPVFDPTYCLRDMSTTNNWYSNTTNGKPVMRHWEGVMERSWADPKHVLPPGDVRFVALNDEDNGSFLPAIAPAVSGAYPATYPRPWFGS
jgi:Tfp pilus assembly protein FimT